MDFEEGEIEPVDDETATNKNKLQLDCEIGITENKKHNSHLKAADIDRADIEGFPPELGCFGLLEGVELLLLDDLVGDIIGPPYGGVELPALLELLLFWLTLGLLSGFWRADGGPINVPLEQGILLLLLPEEGEGDFSSSRRRLRSFLSRSNEPL